MTENPTSSGVLPDSVKWDASPPPDLNADYSGLPQTKEEFLAKQHERNADDSHVYTLSEVDAVLSETIKGDTNTKMITFLGMLTTYTNDSQINIGFLAESSTGKSYIPLEVARLFPEVDIVKLGYASPTAFFHEFGVMLPDPKNEGHKIVHVDLKHKIFIFLDQPHSELLAHMRPLLSHDQPIMEVKITDRREKSGIRTKTVVLEGYSTFIFCSAKYKLDEQEKTRLLLLSPESTQEKLRDSIALKIDHDSDPATFKENLEKSEPRQKLIDRILLIKSEEISDVLIPEDLREHIYRQYIAEHETLQARHQRDIGRLLTFIKGHALLNLKTHERTGNNIVATMDDVLAGFNLYEPIKQANELGLPPEILGIFDNLKTTLEESDNGITRKDFQTLYFNHYHHIIGREKTVDILKALETAGLLTENPDPNDKRINRYVLPSPDALEKLCVAGGEGDHLNNTSQPLL